MKFKLNQSLTTLCVDYGRGLLNFKVGEVIEDILVDVGQNSTKVCIHRTRNASPVINIVELEDYSFRDVSEFLLFLIASFKVKKLHMDYVGVGMGVYDQLIPDLTASNIYLSDDGTLIHNLTEEHVNSLAKSSKQVYYSRLA